jgi:hypothetical protein
MNSGKGLVDFLVAIVLILIFVDLFYKSYHLDCSPSAHWFLKGMDHECQALKEKLAEQQLREKAPRHEEDDD